MKINVWSLLLIVIILYFIFQIREDMLRYYGLVEERQKLATSIEGLKSSNKELNKTIAALNRDELIEALARERLNLVKKGETAYKVCRSISDRK